MHKTEMLLNREEHPLKRKIREQKETLETKVRLYALLLGKTDAELKPNERTILAGLAADKDVLDRVRKSLRDSEQPF